MDGDVPAAILDLSAEVEMAIADAEEGDGGAGAFGRLHP
jgi:hypothetical protein